VAGFGSTGGGFSSTDPRADAFKTVANASISVARVKEHEANIKMLRNYEIDGILCGKTCG